MLYILLHTRGAHRLNVILFTKNSFLILLVRTPMSSGSVILCSPPVRQYVKKGDREGLPRKMTVLKAQVNYSKKGE